MLFRRDGILFFQLKTPFWKAEKKFHLVGTTPTSHFFNGATTPTELLSVFDYVKRKRARGNSTTFDEPVH